MRIPLRSSLRTWTTSHHVVVLGAALCLAQLAFRAWAISGAWFQFDDFAFISRAMNSDLTWQHLTESYAGHLMPAGFLITWLFASNGPLEFWPYALTLLVLQAVATFGFLRLLTHVFGRRAAVLPLLAIYLFSVITMPAFIWWAAGINQLPMLIALFYGLHSHVSYLRTGRLRYVAATLAWTGFGLLFYEKTLLVFLAYGIVALGYFSTGSLEQRVRQLLTTYRTGVVLHSLLVVSYVGIYVSSGLAFDPNNANETPLFPVAYRFIFEAFSTGVIGGPWQWADIVPVGTVANPSEIIVFVSWLAVGYLVYYAARTRAHASRGWLLTATFLVANVVLLAAARAFLAGPDIGLEYRYQTEMSAVFAISVGLAYLPIPGAVESSAARNEESARLASIGQTAVVTLVFVAAATVSNVQYVDHWQSRNRAPEYFSNVESSLKKEDAPVPLVNASVPQYIMWAFRYPENSYRHVFRMWEDQTRYPKIARDEILIFDDQGKLHPALVSPVRRNQPAERGQCGYRVRQKHVTIPLDGPVIGSGWWVRLGYMADGDSPITITAGDLTHRSRVSSGVHSLFFRADGSFESLTISGLAPGVSLCTDDVTLGFPEPIPS